MKLNVSDIIDEGRLVPYQMWLIALTALAIVLDGLDNQLLGTAIPSLMDEWKLPRSSFSAPLAMSPFGMLIGGAVGGLLGDKIGRRTTLLISIFVFAIPTAAIFFAHSVGTLGVFRFLAGIGLGGAMPNATALASEYVPKSKRPFAVTLIIVCIPVGAMLAAFLSAQIIPKFGWRAMFLGGGVIPVVVGILLAFVLPESPRYLANHPGRWRELIRILKRMGHGVDDQTEFQNSATNSQTAESQSFAKLFSPELRRDTLALSIGFFFCLLVVYLALQLLVTALKECGFDAAQSSNVLGWWNIGGVLGAIVGALVIQRLGSKLTMLTLSASATITAFIIASTSITPSSVVTLVFVCVFLGGTINAVQVALYALAAHVYPTEIRGRGIGTVLTVGRLGNILASYVGIVVLDLGGTAAYFGTFGVGMAIVFFSVASVGRHIQSQR